jgi:sugar phosphate isomerase/epimerase
MLLAPRHKSLIISATFLLFSTVCVFAQEYGLQLYSLRNEFAKDAPAAMAKVREMGFKNVEMAGTYGLQFPEVIKLLAQNKLNVVSFGVDFERLEKEPQKVAEEARSYGARFIVCSWIPHRTNNFAVADVDRATAVFNSAGRIISSYGLLLCYHPHGYEFKSHEEGTLFDYMMRKLDQRYVYMEMDVYWMKQAGQEPLNLLKKYPTRFVLMHLKDRKVGTPNSDNGQSDTETNVVLGTGDVGIAEVIREAKKLGIKYYFLEDESSNAVEQLPKSLAYLKSLQQ